MTDKNIYSSNKRVENSSKLDSNIAKKHQEELKRLKQQFKATNKNVRDLQEEIKWLKQQFKVTDKNIKDDLSIPISKFYKTHVLEALVLHLSQDMSIKKISKLLNRSYSTISNTLRKAKPSTTSDNQLLVPVSIFSDRKLAPLQALVKYLHEEEDMRFVDIARALGRDARNVNSTYVEAKKMSSTLERKN